MGVGEQEQFVGDSGAYEHRADVFRAVGLGAPTPAAPLPIDPSERRRPTPIRCSARSDRPTVRCVPIPDPHAPGGPSGDIVLGPTAVPTSTAAPRDARRGTMVRSRLVAAVVVVLGLAVVACGSSDEDAGGGRDRSTSVTDRTTTTTEAPTTTASTSPPLPAAADGSDLAACFDGTCEVLMSAFPAEVPLDPSLGLEAGVQSLTFQALTPDGGLAVALNGPGGGPMGIVTVYADGGTASFNGLDIEALAIDAGTAAVRISPT